MRAPAAMLLLALAATRALADPGIALDQMGAKICGSPHLRLTPRRDPTPEDRARGLALLHALRAATAKLHSADAAIAAGYAPFLPEVPQEVYHFVHRAATDAEYAGGFDAARPGALLFVKRGGRFDLVGAMYSAPENADAAALDARVPLSLAHWHAHANVCLPQGVTLEDLARGDFGAAHPHLAGRLPERDGRDRRTNRRYGFMADGRFGFEGRIATRADCDAAGGQFFPQAWGWMTHVYPYAGDDPDVAFGLSVPAP